MKSFGFIVLLIQFFLCRNEARPLRAWDEESVSPLTTERRLSGSVKVYPCNVFKNNAFHEIDEPVIYKILQLKERLAFPDSKSLSARKQNKLALKIFAKKMHVDNIVFSDTNLSSATISKMCKNLALERSPKIDLRDTSVKPKALINLIKTFSKYGNPSRSTRIIDHKVCSPYGIVTEYNYLLATLIVDKKHTNKKLKKFLAASSIVKHYEGPDGDMELQVWRTVKPRRYAIYLKP